MEFIRGAFNWFAEVIPYLVWLFLCFGCVAGATVKLSELEERLTRDGQKGLGEWFVVMLGTIWVVGFLAFYGGGNIIESFVDAHQWVA